jgi:MFS family permease
MDPDLSAARERSAQTPYAGARSLWLGVLALLILVPVTLPVTVLRDLVHERFGVSELLTSLFMSINMIGAVFAAPLAGAAADRTGRRRDLIVAALVADGALLFALTLPLPFAAFMGLRLLEGCAHIAALSLLLSLAASGQPTGRRGRVMGLVGGGLTLGVAIGAPIGGAIGSENPLVPLYAGAAIVLVAALLARAVLVDVKGEGERPSFGQIVRGIRENRLLLAPLAFAFADRFTVGFYTTTFSLYLSRIFELSPPRIGLLMATFMLPFALLSVPFGRMADRYSRVAMLCTGSAIYGMATASLVWWPAGALPVLMVLLGASAAVMFVPSLVVTTDAAPAEIRGTALAAFNAAGSLGFIAGPLTGGLVSEFVAAGSGWLEGYRWAFGVAGASQILCVAVALPFLRRLIREGRTR